MLDPTTTTTASGSACANCRVEIYKAVSAGGRGVGTQLIGVVNAAGNGAFSTFITEQPSGGNVAAIAIDVGQHVGVFAGFAGDQRRPRTPAAPDDGDVVRFVAAGAPARDATDLPTVDGLFQGGGLVGRGGTVELTVAERGGVPIDAESVALNVTVTETVGPGFVTVYPCGSQQPLASNLNYVGGQTVPNAVIARVGSGGAVCLFVSEGTHLVADVTGYFPPGSGFDSLVPARLSETRSGPGLATADGLFNATARWPATPRCPCR